MNNLLQLDFAINIWIFGNFPFFADHRGRVQGLSKNVSNVIDLYHNMKINGRGQYDPPPSRKPVCKPEVSG